ncbi:hypothetical protein C5167_003302 [Papaver somniferum]|uniref:Uncharacterized protein n=2 Tax=Papaver somniferum TaxID=3469 RepID=A0A4Y7L0M0_PAPSO|nr:hypothetical protein C5167_003302 [Papaver somniferum]
MEFPFGHHHRRNEEDDYPPPPPSFPQHHNHHHQSDFPPPPPQPDYRDQQPFHPNQAEIQHQYHQNPSQQEPNYGYPPPPQQQQPDYGYPPPQQSGYSSTVTHHVSHEVNYPRFEPEFQHENRDHNYNRHDYHNRPENQTVIHHHSHESGGGGGSELLNKPTVRVYCKAEPNYSLAIRDGKVILARSDPSDLSQHWIKDEKYSVRVKDEEGSPSFALINKATGQAMKHSVGATHPVQLRHYNQNELDESVLWAESKDTGEGYRCIRMINNIRLNLDAFHGDKNSGGVHDGTILVLWEWLNGENQRWKIVRYCKSFKL